MELILNNISKSYGSNKALSCFSAELGAGIYALLGPNGSGKSTLMNIITDNLKADSGSILFREGDEAPQDVLTMGVRFREKLGFMPQYPGLYPNFTVERFLWYMAVLKDVGAGLGGRERKRFIREQIDAVLRDVELDDVFDRKIGALSGGMKQRLALAQAVLGSPSILILDEPTAGLDPRQRISIRNYISRIALNKTVLIATHVVSDIEFIARNVIILKKGEIIADSPVRGLTSSIEGKVWLMPAAAEDIGEIQRRWCVTSISHDEKTGGGGIQLRVLSDLSPSASAVPAVPTLEDYYLSVFGSTGTEG